MKKTSVRDTLLILMEAVRKMGQGLSIGIVPKLILTIPDSLPKGWMGGKPGAFPGGL